MKNYPLKLIFNVMLICFSFSTFVSAESDDNLQFSGFARVVVGYLDDAQADYLNYDNSISIDNESLIGLQADYQIIDDLAITGQLIGHSGNKRDSGIEWLYLTYTPSNTLKFKLGKQRTPFLSYSDVIDVGYAYPWATLPQQTYPRHFFSTFDGLMASYDIPRKAFVINIEGYWGYFADKVFVADREMTAKTKNLSGLITNINYKNWTFRGSYHQGQTSVELQELQQFAGILAQLGFINSAESLATAGLTEIYQLSANFENVNYFVRAELNRIQADFVFVPDSDGYFVSTGYHYYPFSSYISYARNKTKYESVVDEIPTGLNPQLDALAGGYQAIFNQLPVNSSEAFTIGTRWDISSGLALKGEVSLIKGKGSDHAFFTVNDTNFDREAILYLAALEWVF